MSNNRLFQCFREDSSVVDDDVDDDGACPDSSDDNANADAVDGAVIDIADDGDDGC